MMFSMTCLFPLHRLQWCNCTHTHANHKTTDQQIHQIDKEIQARKLQVFHYKKSNDPMSRLQIQNLEEEIAALEEQKSGFKKLLKN